MFVPRQDGDVDKLAMVQILHQLQTVRHSWLVQVQAALEHMAHHMSTVNDIAHLPCDNSRDTWHMNLDYSQYVKKRDT